MKEEQQLTHQKPQKKISLSDRFGLWIGFHSVDQDTYLTMIKWYVSHYNIPVEFEDISQMLWLGQWAVAIVRGAPFQYILNLACGIG